MFLRKLSLPLRAPVQNQSKPKPRVDSCFILVSGWHFLDSLAKIDLSKMSTALSLCNGFQMPAGWHSGSRYGIQGPFKRAFNILSWLLASQFTPWRSYQMKFLSLPNSPDILMPLPLLFPQPSSFFPIFLTGNSYPQCSSIFTLRKSLLTNNRQNCKSLFVDNQSPSYIP